MKDTTEQPAAVFSERGLAMFFEFVGKLAAGKLQEGDVSDVNAFLDEWEQHKAGTRGQGPRKPGEGRTDRRRRDWGAERDALKAIMYGKGLMPLMRIYGEMKDDGFWQCEPKQASQQIRRVMERFPGEIVDTRRGTYHWPLPDELVLKLREGETQHEQEGT